MHFLKAFYAGWLSSFLPIIIIAVIGKRDVFTTFFAHLKGLPVIGKLTADFKTGVQLAGATFLQRLEAYNNNIQSDKPLSLATTTPTGEWTWTYDKMEQRLNEKMGSRQARARQKFLTYIRQYAPWAVAEMAQSRIPASVTLAQGILETNAGNSYIARKANNHFGIKCYRKSDFGKDGTIDDSDYYHHALAYDCIRITDDNFYDRFHVYESAALSFKHHTLFLSQQKRYSWMIQQYSGSIGGNCLVESHWFGTKTVPYYAAWCIGLKKAATPPAKRTPKNSRTSSKRMNCGVLTIN